MRSIQGVEKMYEEAERILISKEEIEKTVQRLADEINRDYAGKEIILAGLLKGSFVFMGDLMRKITVPCSIDFMIVSSYGGRTFSSGEVNIKKDLGEDIKDKHVIIVEDIIDSGITLSAVLNILRHREPASLRLCAFLSKPARRQKEVVIDYLGMEIPDEFVIGYGLDYDEKYRNFPFVGILDPKYIHE